MGTRFSDLHAVVQAWQPMQRVWSSTFPHFARGCASGCIESPRRFWFGVRLKYAFAARPPTLLHFKASQSQSRRSTSMEGREMRMFVRAFVIVALVALCAPLVRAQVREREMERVNWME